MLWRMSDSTDRAEKANAIATWLRDGAQFFSDEELAPLRKAALKNLTKERNAVAAAIAVIRENKPPIPRGGSLRDLVLRVIADAPGMTSGVIYERVQALQSGVPVARSGVCGALLTMSGDGGPIVKFGVRGGFRYSAR